MVWNGIAVEPPDRSWRHRRKNDRPEALFNVDGHDGATAGAECRTMPQLDFRLDGRPLGDWRHSGVPRLPLRPPRQAFLPPRPANHLNAILLAIYLRG